VGAAVALGALAIVLFGPHRSISTGDLAQIEAIALRIPRSVPEPGTFEEAWMQALSLYQRAEYREASLVLRELSKRDPDHFESTLLLGSALLLDGQPSDAVTALERAEELATSSTDRDEARWQLANALLLLTSRRADAARAAQLLDGVAQGSSPRAGAAAALSQALAERLGR
jgi:predicted Zn-dependent protease